MLWLQQRNFGCIIFPRGNLKVIVGNTIWTSYFKFTFVRNPYDLVVSHFFLSKNGAGNGITDVFDCVIPKIAKLF